MKKGIVKSLLLLGLAFVLGVCVLPVRQVSAATCNHVYATRKKQSATCTKPEMYETYCTKCYKVVNGTVTAPALGHKFKIWDESGVVSIKCFRDGCTAKLGTRVNDLDSFAKYYKAMGKNYSQYSKVQQDSILSLWLRYDFDFSDKATADKMVEYYRKSNASWLYLSPDKVSEAQKFIEACAYLGTKTHVKKGWFKDTTVKDFENADNLCKGLVCNAYIGFVALRNNVKNDPRYKVFKWALTGLTVVNKDFKYAYKSAKWLISGYASLCNTGIKLCYIAASKTDNVDIYANLEGVDFYDLAMNIDSHYSRVLLKSYGKANETSHNNFIKYINVRINEEFKRIWGVELSSIEGL